ncbi:MAG: type II toxin-antitoxin system RelE/ParE family toxin [Gemmatimonadaceae bacterium]|nr:type II toxin-antitoxin system RelE/ParE family toxin [Chitinophagaceae bacterium]
MKKLPYVISNKALSDLEVIWNYTSDNWSVSQADRYYLLIIDEIEYISKQPEAGKAMNHVRKGYRASKVKSHLIFYSINNEIIQIIRILHERMDVDSRMLE